jgi:hypothetical protein
MTYSTQHINETRRETSPVRVGAFIDRGLSAPVGFGFDVNHILKRLPM